MGEISLTYLRGAGWERSARGALTIDAAGVVFRAKKRSIGPYDWDHVSRITFDDPGRTKANLGALAVFGALGLAARKTFSLVTVTTSEGNVHFESGWSIATWRVTVPLILRDVPAAAGKIYVDGTRDGDELAPLGDQITAQIRQLGQLRDDGLLSAEEFEQKKAELLARL